MTIQIFGQPFTLTPELLLAAKIAAGVVFLLVLLLINDRRHRNKQKELSTQLNSVTGQLEEKTQMLSNLDESHQVLSENYRALELSYRTQEAKMEAQLQRSSDVEKELSVTKQNLQDTIERMHNAEKSYEATQASLIQSRKVHADTELRVEALQNELKSERSEISRLSDSHTRLQTEMDEREASHAREVQNFEKQKESLTEQFKVLSSEILQANTKSLQENSKVTLSAVMNPFQQSIDSFKKEVQEIHNRETMQRGELKKELNTLKELNQKITTEAHELSTALRGQKKLQGNWGELVLENVLDRSGLRSGIDYQREFSVTTEEGRQRPDAVVFLPQEKHLIIDAKVSLNAYTRFVNTEDEAERAIALAEHVQAMRDRIKELADRDYYKLPGLNSPEMVFMFVPIESAFVEALKADEQLFQSAIENNVLVATPTTLLTSLNIVRQLWRYEDQNKHTVALAQKAEGVFKKLNTFLGSFENIKKSLDKANESYTKAENQLLSGKGNLVKQVGEFKNLAPAIKAELPQYYTEKAALELELNTAEPEQQTLLSSATPEPESASKVENASKVDSTPDLLDFDANKSN